MGSNYLYIHDLVSFSLTSPELVRVQDDFTGNPTGHTSTGLEVSFAATHAGIITRNNGFYLPDKMRRGATTFLDNFAKPILLHHKTDIDPIGRVVRAEYVDNSLKVADMYRGYPMKNKAGRDVSQLNDSLIQDFSSGKMPFGMQVDVIRNLLDHTLLADSAYEGMGYIKLTANITDKEAVEKFLDGRYMTGSVGAKTDKAVCSVCKTDWVSDGQCDHKPGAVYDKNKCYIIAGELSYDEYSVVNKPADRHSKVLELNYNNIKNSVEVANEFSSRIYDVTLEFPQYSMEENGMKVKVQDSTTDTTTTVVDATTVVDTTTPEETLEQFLTRILSLTDAVIDDSDEEKLYALMLAEMKATGLTDQELTDATLSPESRKKLPSSTFCGPGKSFPAPDCAHITAAHRLIDAYKGEGNKDSLVVAITRKAKAMGCELAAPKDSTTETVVTDATPEAFDATKVVDFSKVTTAEHVKTVFDLVVAEAKKQNLSVLKDLVRSEETSLLDEIIKLETLAGALREELTVTKAKAKDVQDEYEALNANHQLLNDTLVQAKVQTRSTKEKYLGLLTDLKDTKVEDRNESFKAISDEVLDTQIENTSKEVDIHKIAAKLNDGMSRTPNGKVENPVANVLDNSDKNKDGTVVEDQVFARNFLMIEKTQGRKAADAFRLQYSKQKESKLPTGKQ